MSGATKPEFSRRVSLARLGSERFCRKIAATAAECAALARRFDLLAVDRLHALVELVRQGHDRVLLRATFDAEFVQRCVVTLDPVRGALTEQFALLYGPPEIEEEVDGAADSEVAFEPIAGDAIDIGEAVAQEFALALPPFPRSAGADAEAAPPPSDEPGPFAALSRLVARDKR
jgi:uncharacterized metal-binding protein YceD (DUF177 family)